MKYIFFLRSGANVIVTIPGGIQGVLDRIQERVTSHGELPENQWIASPELTESVRWTDIEAWRLVRD